MEKVEKVEINLSQLNPNPLIMIYHEIELVLKTFMIVELYLSTTQGSQYILK